MRTIKVAGIDPSLTHTGIAKAIIDIDTGLVTVSKILCVATEGETGKTVRRNSDDLRRSGLIAKALYDEVSDCDVIFSEVPTGAQSSRAAFGFGMVIGILAAVIHSPSFKPAFIQVLPHQVKSAVPGGSKNTSKEEIIDWAVTSWPQAGWADMKGRKYEFAGLKLNANVEHPADACAAINAGLLTDDFKNLLALFNKLLPVAA